MKNKGLFCLRKKMQKNKQIKPTIEIIRKGVIVIRNLLSIQEQLAIIDIVKRKGGLMKDNEWNFFKIRGRTFDALHNYPKKDEDFLRLCFKRMRKLVEEADAEIPITTSTHMLTWWYPSTKGMGYHQDGYGGNDGDKDAPVYSLTVGNSCIFDWKPVGNEKKIESAEICGGDVIVFGGPQRMMYHRVKKVLQGTFIEKDFDVRINLTFRKLSEFTEKDEARFQTDVYEKRILEEYKVKNERVKNENKLNKKN